MNNDNTIDSLLRKSAADFPSTYTVSARDMHSRIISYEKSQRRFRQSIWFGVFPASAVVGVFSMWMVSLPANWMIYAVLANAIFILAFSVFAKLIAR